MTSVITVFNFSVGEVNRWICGRKFSFMAMRLQICEM